MPSVVTTTGRVENDRTLRLIRAYRASGDQRAIRKLFEEHGRILNHIVRRYSGSSNESYEDLLQVGYVGLVKAVNGYKIDSSAKFSSYAYSMIDGEIRHHFRDTALVKRPRWARSLYAKVTEATNRLTAELGRPPVVEEIAHEVNVTPAGVLELMKLFLDTNVASLDGERENENGVDVAAIRNIQYEPFALPLEDKIQLDEALQTLSEIQRQVVYLFFYKDLSQTEIGQMLDLSQRKVSRIIVSATKSLRGVLTSKE